MSSETVHTAYSFSKTVPMGYEDAIEYVTEALRKEGFGVLTNIDVRATLKKKIGVDLRSYAILGACSPHHAYEAIQKETELGLVLPCNVIVYVNDGASMQAIENPALEDTGLEVQGKLRKVIENL
jgi:uncharacterized protein (DUF302 family)